MYDMVLFEASGIILKLFVPCTERQKFRNTTNAVQFRKVLFGFAIAEFVIGTTLLLIYVVPKLFRP